jgi:two-component system response regulator DevR
MLRIGISHVPTAAGGAGVTAANSPSNGGTTMVRILIVEDHPIVREGIRAELASPRFSVVAEVATGAQAIAAAADHQPDVVLLDLNLPDRPGAEVCAAILERVPTAAVIVLSASGDETSVREAVDAGARAYLIKDVEHLDLPGAVDRVLWGESVMDPRAAAALIRNVQSRNEDPRPQLSSQELNILRLVAEGYSNPEIGARLFLSRHTVKEYLSNAMRKLDVSSRLEAVLEAQRLNLLDGRGPGGASALERKSS